MIEQLDQPVERDMRGVPVMCTHRAVGVRYAPWASRSVAVDTLYGVMREGRFVQVAGDTVELKDADAEPILRAMRGVIRDADRQADQARQRRGLHVYMNVQGTEASTPDGSVTLTRQDAQEDGMVVVPNGLARNGWRRMRDNSFEEVAGS